MNYEEASRKLIMCSSFDRFQTFLEIKDQLNDKDYWKVLSDAYTGSDNLFRFSDEIKEAFIEERKFRPKLMSRKDLKHYNNLPEVITIYRGMTIEEFESGYFGVSWTLSKKVAEFFANQYGRNHDTSHLPKIVHKLEVPKQLICAYFSGRNEQEVVYIGF